MVNMARRSLSLPEIEPKIFTSTDEIDRAMAKLQRRTNEIDEIDIPAVGHRPQATAPILDSTLAPQVDVGPHFGYRGRRELLQTVAIRRSWPLRKNTTLREGAL